MSARRSRLLVGALLTLAGLGARTRDAQAYPFERRLSLLDASMVVLGAIIGSGIFINPYVVAATVGPGAGRGGVVLGLWVFGGVVALVGALVYSDLGVLRPRAGGQYVYLSEALHPLAGFLYGWALLLVIQTGAMAFIKAEYRVLAVFIVCVAGRGGGRSCASGIQSS